MWSPPCKLPETRQNADEARCAKSVGNGEALEVLQGELGSGKHSNRDSKIYNGAKKLLYRGSQSTLQYGQ